MEVDFKNGDISFSSDKMRANITAKMNFDNLVTHTRANVSTNITDIQIATSVKTTMDGDLLNVTIDTLDVKINDFNITVNYHYRNIKKLD